MLNTRPTLALTLLSTLMLFYSSASLSSDDWGTSTNLLLKKNLDDEWFLLSRSNLATRQDNEQLFLGYTGLSAGFNLSDKSSVRAGFRFARFRIGDEWRSERRPMLEIYYAHKAAGWRITSRSRSEFRSPDWRQDDVRLRQEITVTAPWKFTSWHLKPYLEEEIFYSLNNHSVDANWFTLGLSFFPEKGMKVKAGYRHNRLRLGNTISTRHVLTGAVNFFF